MTESNRSSLETISYGFSTAAKALFLTAMLLDSIPFLYERYGGLVKIFLCLCLAAMLLEFITDRRRPARKDLGLLMLFSASYAVTIFVNRSMFFTENLKQLVYMIMIFGFFYLSDIRQKGCEFALVSRVFQAGVLVLSAICMWTFFLRIDITYWQGEAQVQIGMFDNRLWGLYNPNTGSTLAMISIFLSLYFLEVRKTIPDRVFDLVNLVLQYVLLVLSGSRAPLVFTAVGCGLLVSIMLWRKSGSAEKSIILVPGMTALVCAALVAASFLVKPVMAGIPGKILSGESSAAYSEDVKLFFQTYLGVAPEEPAEKPVGEVDFTRKEEEEERPGGILTGRDELWQAGFRGFLDHPIWGTGREGIYDVCAPYLHDETWQGSLSNGGLHNIFLTILVSSGITGSLIMMAFLLYLTVFVVKSQLKRGTLLKNPIASVSLIIILMMGANELLEARILYRVGIFYPVFWLYLGYLVSCCRMEESES